MSMTIPTIPAMPAGYVVQAADLNNLAYAAQFLLTKPATRVHDGVGGQALVTTGTAIQYSVADFDTDSMWSSGSPTQLTVQTPGFFKIDYMIDQNNGISYTSVAQITTGTNNPAGSGISTQCWPGGSFGASNRCCARAGGILPFYMYALDYVQVLAYPDINGSSTSSAPATFTPSYLALELVSI